MIIKFFLLKIMIKGPISRLALVFELLILSSTASFSSTAAYPRASDVFLHVADYGRTGVYAEQFLKAFDVLSYSILVFTLAFIVFAVVQVLNFWRKVQYSKKCKKCRADIEDDADADA